MPTALIVGPYSFIFFSSDRDEPPHIHIKRDKQLLKYWLDPVKLDKNRGFKDHELNQIEKLVIEHQTQLIQAWHDYFDPDR
ncbi:MAG: DUF4160 domain-containing protein [Cyanobacteria bacterium P01_D01_bin.73]